jgi:hypothetical protein
MGYSAILAARAKNPTVSKPSFLLKNGAKGAFKL